MKKRKPIPLEHKYEMRRLREEENLSFQAIANRMGYSKRAAVIYGGNPPYCWDSEVAR